MSKKIGCLGIGTETSLNKYNLTSDFSGSKGVKEVAKEFSEQLGEEKVLFPGAVKGRRSIQQNLKLEQAIDLAIYETIDHPTNLQQEFDIVVFTSPSNVRSYFNSGNSILGEQRAIAIGESTEEELSKNNITSAVTWSYKEVAWVDAVNSISIPKN